MRVSGDVSRVVRVVLVGLSAGLCLATLQACGDDEGGALAPAATGEVTAESGMPADAEGVRMVTVTTPRGPFQVWTRQLGEHPTVKVLLLHGGPGATWDYITPVADMLVDAGYEVYLYNQLGSYLSDQPEDPALWTTERFVDEVEQVRKALGLDADSLVLFGHSWGGILGIEYALAHGEHLKGLVISNMMASIPEYNRYAEEVLIPDMDPDAVAEIRALEAAHDVENPRYMELLMGQHYVKHFLRMPPEEWPAAVNHSFEHLNHDVYVLMQGPSELGASGRIEGWDRTDDLSRITVPTLVIGAGHDTMDPAHMEWMAGQLPEGRYLYCPDGSHLAMWDDPEVYREGLLVFMRDLE